MHGPIIALAVTNVLYKKQAQIQEEELDNYGDDDLWGNEENAENKCDDYHGDELGLEYEVDEEVELAEIQLDIKKMKKIVVLR